MPSPLRAPRKALIASLLRTILTTLVLGLAYFFIPFTRVATGADVALLVVSLIAPIALVVFETRSVLRADFPGLRAMEVLAICLPLLLIVFAATYYLMARQSTAAFGQTLTRLDSLYFTVTVFGTVGFGDIVAHTPSARSVVTAQILADLLFLGVAVRAIVGAAKLGRERAQS